MRADPGDPFAPERIVVPHPTMGRWLSLELARTLGIAANVRFEQPAEFAWSIMRGVVPDLSREQPYLPARLRWRIHDLLPGPDGAPGAEPRRGGHRAGGADSNAAREAPDNGGGSPRDGRPACGTDSNAAREAARDEGGRAHAPERAVAGYLRDGDPRKRLELADRLAGMYDKCLLYRPDWIREWERGPAPHWQARLWQRLVAADGPGGAHHWVNALDRFRAGRGERTRTGGSERPGEAVPPAGSASSPPGWPRRACFFAVPSLSPSYLELIREAGREIEIHLFAFNPCREYWGDIHSRREIDYRAGGADPDARYLTQGNELLATWGRAGRDSIDALVEIHDAEWEEHFVAPAGACRLAAVQRDILDLRLADEAARRDEAPGGASGDSPNETSSGRTPEMADADLVAGGLGGAWDEAPPRRAPEAAGSAPAAGAPGGASDEAPFARTPKVVDSAPAASAPGGASGGTPAPPSAEGAGAAGATGPAPDDSIQIHVCHSPVREAEVLHDRLLAVFDAHPDLEPADVLILTPDLDVYGSAVEAVFTAAGRVPCHVARARAAQSRTMRAFLDLLSLPGSRQGAETVLAPLAAPAVRTRFGFGDADVPVIREWVREAGIRWGVDEAHRDEEGLPATADHTWRHGLRRLLLSYAMADADAPVAGLVPCRAGAAAFDPGNASGETDGERLGRFVSYCEGVLGLRHRLAGRRRPAHWAAELRALVRDFLADGSEPFAPGAPGRRPGSAAGALPRDLADEVGAVRALIREFENEAAAGESPVPVEVVVDVLRERTQDPAREAARLTHGVTVASLGAGRIFPAGVVCVVGMNDGVFPRSPSAPSFDVVAAGRARRGDRDIRYEDRFAFLEALLAARRCFIVTHAGRGLRDDAPIPPSVLVDELKDYLGRRFPGAPAEVRHPLQPFSARYFEAPGAADSRARDLFSYSDGMCAAANVRRTAGEPRSRFADAALSAPDASCRRVDLADLTSFFAHPTRYFLRERLGVRLELEDLTLEDEEPFELDGLERHRLQSDVWHQVQAGVEPERGAALLHGSGRLPQAGLGRIVHEDARAVVEPLEALLAPYRGALRAPPRSLDLAFGEFHIVGAFEHVAPDDDAPDGWASCESGPSEPAPSSCEPGSGESAPPSCKPGTGGPAPSSCEPGSGESVPPSCEPGSGEPAPRTMIWWRLGKLRARDRIEIRLRQLAWMAAGYGPLEVLVVSRSRDGKSWQSATFAPPEDARDHLGRWLAAWWRGQSAPLPLFPETSFAYAKAIARAGDDDGAAVAAAREQAASVWYGDSYLRGECLDPYLALVHESGDPLADDDFGDLAEQLLVPLARAQP